MREIKTGFFTLSPCAPPARSPAPPPPLHPTGQRQSAKDPARVEEAAAAASRCLPPHLRAFLERALFLKSPSRSPRIQIHSGLSEGASLLEGTCLAPVATAALHTLRSQLPCLPHKSAKQRHVTSTPPDCAAPPPPYWLRIAARVAR